MNTLMEQYNDVLTRINNDELNGVLTEEEAQFHRENLMAELEEAQFSEELELADEDVAEFTAGNSLGALLLEVGQNQGYDDAEEYIYDLSNKLEITPEEVFDLITTDEEPDDELTYAVASELGLIDDEAEDYEEEDEVEEEYDDEGEEESSYSQYPTEAMFSDPRVDQLESQIAEFQVQNALKDTLHKLDLRGQELVNNGDMPPMAYNILFSSFDTEDDRIAAFSQVAEANGNTLTEELTAIEKTLEIFSRMGLGELGLFSQLIEDESVGEFSQEEAAIELEAELNAKHFLTRNK